MPLRSYSEAVDFLHGRIDYERQRPTRDAEGAFMLDRMRRLLERLGDPHLEIPAVHIAGTKGKGSTAAMTAAMLTAAGRRTGLFTSPHIARVEERFTVDGVLPTEAEFVDVMNRVRREVDRLDREAVDWRATWFEIITAAAWVHFVSRGCELAVMEVGLGGRLDSTNLCRPIVTAITSISYDHTHILGDTIEQIAAEKAGIIKPGVPVVSGVCESPAREVIGSVAKSRHARLYQPGVDFTWDVDPHVAEPPTDAAVQAGAWVSIRAPFREWDRVRVPLTGAHQAANAAVAVTAVDVVDHAGIAVSHDAVRAGLADVQCPLRIEVVGREPVVVLDAAHNPASVTALVETLESRFQVERRILVFATSRDKDAPEMLLRLIPTFDVVVLTEFQSNPRAIPVHELAAIADDLSCRECRTAADPESAMQTASDLARPADLICVTGSFFLAAEVRTAVYDPASQQRPRVKDRGGWGR